MQTQLTNPWIVLALLIYAALVVTPLIAWIEAQTWQRRAALVAVLFCVACSLPAFFSTPNGVIGDTLEIGRRWSTGGPTYWWQFFGGTDANQGTGWNLLPLSWGWAALGTWKVERVIGLSWHCLLVVSVCAFPFVDAAAVPIVVAILCATRFGLWLQRHHLGSEILLQQALLLSCLMYARRENHWRWLAAVAMLVALLQYTYLAAAVTLSYPLIWLWRSWRTVGVYGMTALLCVPLVISPSDFIARQVASPDSPVAFSWQRNLALVLSFWDERYSREQSWAWSYPGAQHLPHLVCALIVCGIALALWSTEGRRWIATALVGLVPAMGFVGPVPSHRQMMCLIPLAVLAGWPMRVVARRVRAPWAFAASALAAAGIAYLGLCEWHNPAFWTFWFSHGDPGNFTRLTH